MKNLARISGITSEVLVKRSKVLNINESLVKVLHKTNNKFTRLELVDIITEMRLKAQGFSDEDINDPKKVTDQMIKDVAKTVKNGLDTSISRSNNNSSFHYNEKYSHLKLDVDAQERYYIVESKKA